MAVCGCGFCSYAIRYHGEPEGTEPVEHVFCTLDNWSELELENLTADWLEMEHEENFFYAWRCKRCETFTFFDYNWNTIGTYTPKDEFSSEPMQEPFESGPFWNDFQWFDINENGTPASKSLQGIPIISGSRKTMTSCAFTPTRRARIASRSSDGLKSSRPSPSLQCRLNRSRKCLLIATT